MKLFRNRPMVVEAVQWTGDNAAEVQAFADLFICYTNPVLGEVWNNVAQEWLRVRAWDWVVKSGDTGCFYPIDPLTMAAAFEPVLR